MKKQTENGVRLNIQNNMITIDGIEYINGSRVPVAPIREMVKSYNVEMNRQLDDDLPDWQMDHDLKEQVSDYIRSYGVIVDENGIENIIQEVSV